MCSYFVQPDRGVVGFYKILFSGGVCKIDAALDVHVLSERHMIFVAKFQCG
jgi:hypothetical protein